MHQGSRGFLENTSLLNCPGVPFLDYKQMGEGEAVFGQALLGAPI